MRRTSGFLRTLESIAERGLTLIRGQEVSPATPISRIAAELLSEKGEASEVALARELVVRYSRLTTAEKEQFFYRLLQPPFQREPHAIEAAFQRYANQPDAAAARALFSAVEPPRQELFRRANSAPGGTDAIIAMRAELLELLPSNPQLECVDDDLRHLLAAWFNRGFLRLERINWRTPAIVLERLIQHESVHEIRSWADLHRRLEDDRRCFAFFHPALPDAPLIFVAAALTRGTPASIAPLLDVDAPRLAARDADTATFYSINNCLPGLRSISFGNFLIKQVIAELRAERLKLRHFVTLSPIPGFRSWLQSRPEFGQLEDTADAATGGKSWIDDPSWVQHERLAEELKPLLMARCADYLLQSRIDGNRLDSVAAFHLRNGASVARINWLGDRSAKGIGQSFGLMVNYMYRLTDIELNHETFVKGGKVAASAEVRALLRPRR
jgi:malonyl-CoA decarboxylase